MMINSADSQQIKKKQNLPSNEDLKKMAQGMYNQMSNAMAQNNFTDFTSTCKSIKSMDSTMRQHICDMISTQTDQNGQSIMQIALKIDASGKSKKKENYEQILLRSGFTVDE